MDDSMEFAGRTVLVTGSATALGFATATAFLDRGARVMVNSDTQATLDAALGRLARHGDRVAGCRADIRDSADVAGLFEATAERFQGLDILVNNAGTNSSTPVEALAEAEWDRVVDTNLKGTFLVCKAAIPLLKRAGRGGRIVNIASTAGRSARIGAAAYCASKAGVLLLTQTLALELGRDGITVNAVCPGFIYAEDKTRQPSSDYREAFVAGVPLGRVGEPRDIAEAVLFLASQRAKYITGDVMTVDGGTLAGRYSLPDSRQRAGEAERGERT
jgi:NAD(P)-dependent dehydrogenase (short-subunit alcohol dehydrogenase family)